MKAVRLALLVLAAGYGLITAALLWNWRYISPYAAPAYAQELLDRFERGSVADLTTELRKLGRFSPAIALIFEGQLAEQEAQVGPHPLRALATARQKYAAAAEMGGATAHEAYVRLALLLKRHQVPGEDHFDVAELLERARSLGSSRAAYELGLLYESGEIVGRNRRRALALFQEAAAYVPEAALKTARYVELGEIKMLSRSYVCQSALERDPGSARKRDPRVGDAGGH